MNNNLRKFIERDLVNLRIKEGFDKKNNHMAHLCCLIPAEKRHRVLRYF